MSMSDISQPKIHFAVPVAMERFMVGTSPDGQAVTYASSFVGTLDEVMSICERYNQSEQLQYAERCREVVSQAIMGKFDAEHQGI
ncbi:hypothetical protein CSIRO_2779 [Bradyrhizobiaceae bacterium SG-6C]|nr:hypothetical protein CSIRO_2779 [Bradyrhizobiaceae bacterium SG-6C]